MKRVLWGGIGVVAIAAVAGGLTFAGQPCGPLDRSGCVASFKVADMTGLGDTLAVASGEDGLIWAAGVRYTESGRSQTQDIRLVVALIDVETGAEVRRLSPSDTGFPIQLAVSPDGSRVAVANSTIYVRSTDLLVLDQQGETLWSRALDEYDLVPDAEGHAVALAFDADGALFADPLSFDAQGDPIDPQPVDRRWIEATEVGIDMPDGFVPWTYATTAISPDETREAILVRRFDRGTGVRAILEVRDRSGATLQRHEIADDLTAALVWDPLGRGVIVARAGPFEIGADTQLRVYTAEVMP